MNTNEKVEKPHVFFENTQGSGLPFSESHK